MSPVAVVGVLPTFISPADHHALQTTTPTSFADIPPVLRHKQDDVAISFDPPLAAFEDPATRQGTLYVAENALFFLSSTTGVGFRIEYPVITLHAISRAESGPSIYCQLDESLGVDQATDVAGEEDDAMRELIIVPQSVDSLETIFESLSLCASLHPDPATGDEEGDDAFIDGSNGTGFETFHGDENEELSAVGRAALEHLESIIYDPHEYIDSEATADAEEEAPPAGEYSEK